MKIKVTQNHINLGVTCNPRCCPIALAIREATGIHAVVANIIRLQNMDNIIIFERPSTQEELNFVRAFDRGQPVEPFEFEIDYENPPD